MIRRYRKTSEKPNGVPEDPSKCIVSVYPHRAGWCWWISRQCLNPRGHGPNGEYCSLHSKRFKKDK